MATFRAPDPGQLRARVTITKPTVDGIGEDGKPKIDDVILCKDRYASWTETLGGDVIAGDEDRHMRTVEIVMRWLPDVTALCNIVRVGDAEPWQIRSVIDPTDRREWLQIAAEKVVLR